MNMLCDLDITTTFSLALLRNTTVAVWFVGSSNFVCGGNSFAVSFILAMILGDKNHVGIEDVFVDGVMGVHGVHGDVAFGF